MPDGSPFSNSFNRPSPESLPIRGERVEVDLSAYDRPESRLSDTYSEAIEDFNWFKKRFAETLGDLSRLDLHPVARAIIAELRSDPGDASVLYGVRDGHVPAYYFESSSAANGNAIWSSLSRLSFRYNQKRARIAEIGKRLHAFEEPRPSAPSAAVLNAFDAWMSEGAAV